MDARYRKLSAIQGIEIIARGSSIRNLAELNSSFGKGRWRKLKGVATVQMWDGSVCVAELHWYEAHGIGKRAEKIKRVISR